MLLLSQCLNWLYYNLTLIHPFCVSSGTMCILWFGSMFTVTTLDRVCQAKQKLAKAFSILWPKQAARWGKCSVLMLYRCFFAYKSHQVGFHSRTSYFSQRDPWIDFSVCIAVNCCMVWVTSKRERKLEAAASHFLVFSLPTGFTMCSCRSRSVLRHRLFSITFY